MKDRASTPVDQSVSIRSLKITTGILLHPDFSVDPLAFARRHGVDLVDDVYPELDFRKNPDDPDDPGYHERIEVIRANIHLVQHRAIRLFAERDGAGDRWVRSIDIDPSLLLYGAGRLPLRGGDVALSLSILIAKVSPLLANPLDALHIVPGLVRGEESVAFWSKVDSEILLPGVEIPCLHHLGHPVAGRAWGATKGRIQLGDNKDQCLIRIKELRGEPEGPDRKRKVEGIRVRLVLKGRKLVDAFGASGTTAKIRGTQRLVAFTEPGVARAHQGMMAQLGGTYLPVPTEWKSGLKGNPLTLPKAFAFLSSVMPISLEELMAIDEEIRHPSASTRKRLRKDSKMELGRFAPVPACALFDAPAYAPRTSSHLAARVGDVELLVAAAYGMALSPGGHDHHMD